MPQEYIEGYTSKINEFAKNYIKELLKEKERVPDYLPLCAQLIDDAIDRIYETGRIPGKPFVADVYRQSTIKLCQRVHLPIKQNPTFNFKGKILGPQGNTLKRLHKETMCSIVLKGRNSLRYHEKEEAMRQSGNPAHNHLNGDMYVEISTIGPPAESYARMAYALSEIRKYIVPDKHDDVSKEQYRELLEIDPNAAKKYFLNKNHPKSVFDKLGFNGGSSSAATDPKDETEDSDSASRPDHSTFLTKTKNVRSQPYQKNRSNKLN